MLKINKSILGILLLGIIVLCIGCESSITDSPDDVLRGDPVPAFNTLSGTDITVNEYGVIRPLTAGDLLQTVCKSGWVSGSRYVTETGTVERLSVNFCSPYGIQGAMFGDTICVYLNGIPTDLYHVCSKTLFTFDISGTELTVTPKNHKYTTAK